jgi:hypothetical protein
MISPYAHISMTYQPPASEPKHVHRIERTQRQPKVRSSRRMAVARRLHLAPRQA